MKEQRDPIRIKKETDTALFKLSSISINGLISVEQVKNWLAENVEIYGEINGLVGNKDLPDALSGFMSAFERIHWLLGRYEQEEIFRQVVAQYYDHNISADKKNLVEWMDYYLDLWKDIFFKQKIHIIDLSDDRVVLNTSIGTLVFKIENFQYMKIFYQLYYELVFRDDETRYRIMDRLGEH